MDYMLKNVKVFLMSTVEFFLFFFLFWLDSYYVNHVKLTSDIAAKNSLQILFTDVVTFINLRGVRNAPGRNLSKEA